MKESSAYLKLQGSLSEALSDIKIVDIHSHMRLNEPSRCADIKTLLYYHMLQYPLRSSGAKEVISLSHNNAELPFDTMVDLWEKYGQDVMHTSFGWIFKKIIKDLYGIDRNLERKNLAALLEAFQAKHQDKNWPAEILNKGKIVKLLSSANNSKREDPGLPVEQNSFTEKFVHTLEAGMSSIMEDKPFSRLFAHYQEHQGKDLKSIDQLRDAISGFMSKRIGPFDFNVYVSWISSFADFRKVDDSVLDDILLKLSRGEYIDIRKIGLLDAEILRCNLKSLQDKIKVFQLCYGTQYLHQDEIKSHPVQRAANSFASELGFLIEEFPDIHFNILNGFEPDEPLLNSLCLGYSNVSLGGFWWHTFYASIMQNSWQRRLDMVPVNSLMGFFSDGYCAEWVYGRAALTRQVLANVFAERIMNGFCDFDEALLMAEKVLYDTPTKIMLNKDK